MRCRARCRRPALAAMSGRPGCKRSARRRSRCGPTRDSQVLGHDTAQPDATDQTFVAGLDHRRELPVEQFSVDLRRGVGVGGLVVDAEIHCGQSVGPQRRPGSPRWRPAARRAPARAATRPVSSRLGADLAHQGQISGVGMQRLADQFIGHVRPVELRRVDVVDAQLDCALRTASAWSWSRGGPKTPGPGSCMAPKPTRPTVNEPSGKGCMAPRY